MLSILKSSGDEYTNKFVETNDKKIITYIDYIKNKEILKKIKVTELKQIAKSYRLPISGTKPLLIQRIENLFLNSYFSIKIQKIFRGYIVRQSFKLRGAGLLHRTICVNESDFYSLEPLNEIPVAYFFTFSCGKFVYGCNIISLIHLIKSKSVITNPYNREVLKIDVVNTVIQLYSLIRILFGLPDDAPCMKAVEKKPVQIINTNPFLIAFTVLENRAQKIAAIRLKSVEERINELFIEIDQLGNYTQSVWFSQLERRHYIRLFRTLYDIWNFRGQLSREVKVNICVLYDPFSEINRERLNWYNEDSDVLKDICLKIMENMIYCGVDDEYRKIGALHVLTALTNVSLEARHAMPWLFDTLY